MNLKQTFKEFLWRSNLYSATRQYYRRLNPKIVEGERKETEFYQKIIKKDDIVFDVGAHLGDKTNAFLNCGAVVVAVEPQKKYLQHIKHRFKNQSSHIHLLQKGLSAQPEKRLFYARRNGATSGFVKDWLKEKSWASVDQVMELETTTLDLLIKEYGVPKYIKIDVETFEIEVLRGLSQPVPLVSFEFFPHYLERGLECINRLCEISEGLFNLTPMDESRFLFDQWQPREEFEKFLKENWDRSKLGYRGDIYFQSSIFRES